MDADEFKFTVEWFDELGGVARRYLLTFYRFDRDAPEVSIFDYTKKRMFLKRTQYPDMRLEDCFVGGLVSVFARQFKIVGYADEKTRNAFESENGQLVAILPPSQYDWGAALSASQGRGGFKITRVKTIIEEGAVKLAVELVGQIGNAPDAELWHLLFPGMGKTNLTSVRVVRRSEETDQLFESRQSTATFDNCSCLVALPHLVKDGVIGEIVSRLVDANFEISCASSFTMTRVEAEDFYEVYKGVIPQSDFAAKTLELSSGPCVAFEVRAENAVNELRSLAGPADVETAQKLRPNSLRAVFGRDRIRNAVHVTDLADDAVLESQFFFDILANNAKK